MPFLYAREFQVFSGFGVIGSLSGKANVRYFLSERSLSKRGLKLLQRCNKKRNVAFTEYLKILGFYETLMLRNVEVLQGIDVKKC